MGLRSWITSKRYGGQTGLNEMGNSATMAGLFAGPVLVVWLLLLILCPVEFMDIGVIVMFGGWVAYLFVLHSGAKADANNYRAFPQPKWRFPDGGQRTYNVMLIPPDAFKKVCEFEDGDMGYHLTWPDKFQYHQKGMPYPFVWNSALIKLPSNVDKSFAFSSAGEFYHKGIAIEHPASENVTIYVVDWDIKEGVVEPLCVVNDCAFRYEELLKNSNKIKLSELPSLKRMQMIVRDGKKRQMDFLRTQGYLEDALEVEQKTKSKKYKATVEDGIKAVRSRVFTIMDTEESLIKRVFTWKNLFKVALFFGVVLLVLWFLGWI